MPVKRTERPSGPAVGRARMQNSKPLIHNRSISANSWNTAAQGAALTAAFLFVIAMVCGAI